MVGIKVWAGSFLRSASPSHLEPNEKVSPRLYFSFIALDDVFPWN